MRNWHTLLLARTLALRIWPPVLPRSRGAGQRRPDLEAGVGVVEGFALLSGQEFGAHGVPCPVTSSSSLSPHCTGGPAPVRRFPARADRADQRPADRPRQGFDLTLPLDQAAEGYRAMVERHPIKFLLPP